MIDGELSEALEVMGGNGARRLGLDGDRHLIDHKIHFDTARQPPIAEGRKSLRITVVGGDLMEAPVLERVAKELRARLQLSAAGEESHDPDVGEIEIEAVDLLDVGRLLLDAHLQPRPPHALGRLLIPYRIRAKEVGVERKLFFFLDLH